MDIINEIKKAVEVNPMGHLPLLYRVLLTNQVKQKETLLKVYLECSKKVFSIWQDEYPNNMSVYGMLSKADNYLYNMKGPRKDFIQLADKHKNFIEGINTNAGAAGLSALSLCYNIGADLAFDESYNGVDDDDSIEYEDRWPDFYASVAYSGGNPFAFEGDIEKRREFWNWYISVVEMLIDKPNIRIIPLVEKNVATPKTEQLERVQSYGDTINEELIQKLISMTTELLRQKKERYNLFKVNMSAIVFSNTYDIYVVKNGKQSRIELSIDDRLKFRPIDLFCSLKKNMYKQAPQEGAWLNCSLIVENNSYKFDFNYDSKDNLFDSDINDAILVAEFEKYPRAKEYTPSWWKGLLGNKAKYL